MVIKEIKKHYPEKYVIAYTAGGLNNAIGAIAKDNADYLLLKDADIDEWIDTLDNATDYVLNPVNQWKRIRSRMLESGVTPYQVAVLENEFVKSMEIDGVSNNSNVLRKVNDLGLSKDVRTIVINMISAMVLGALS